MTTRHPTEAERFAATIARIDELNAADPVRVRYEGADHPKEPLHAELMTRWVLELDPDADELALLAARAHHLRRWMSPRNEFPEGRKGYLRWRSAAQQRHAAEIADVMAAQGYEDSDTQRVVAIITKKALRTDPVVQTHEDARCLVFLQTQFDQLNEQLGDDSMIQVLERTIPKMSPAALNAVGRLDLSDRARSLLDVAAERAAQRRSGD